MKKRNKMEQIALKLGGVGCLFVAVYAWSHGIQNGWIIALGIIGALEAL